MEDEDQVTNDAESTAAETAAAAEESKQDPDEVSSKKEEVEELPPVNMPKIEKAYEEVIRITESFAWKNFLLNDKQYKATFGSE